MRGLAALVLVIAVNNESAAIADDAPPLPDNNITATLDYGITGGYARSLTSGISGGVTATYLPRALADYALAGGGAHLTYRIGDRSLQPFIEAHVLTCRVFDVNDDPELETTAIIAGAAVGARWYWRRVLNIGLGVGVDRTLTTVDECIGRCIVSDERLYLRPFVDVGYAF